ncbi:MAG: alpha/beta hydrolase [Chlorobi bacterium]|nr:alpha/beta hydrolase [Chlorobiota bacterium]
MESSVRSSSSEQRTLQPTVWKEFVLKRYTFTAYWSGIEPANASAAIVCLPNRTSTAERFIRLGQHMITDGSDLAVTVVALDAPDLSSFWYPKPAFDAPLEMQLPYLDISLAAIEQLCQQLANHISIEDISLFGFAEGACVALEYMVRCGYPLNAVVALSGVLLGSSLESSDRFHSASTRTKVLISLGGGISAAQRVRFRQTEQLLKQFGYKVVALTFERRPDTVSPQELEMGRHIINGTLADL